MELLIQMVPGGGGQNAERSNVERPIFRSFKISNIKKNKRWVIRFFIFEFIFYFNICLSYSNIQNI